MKKVIPLMISTLALLTSCDSPRSQRAISSSYNNGLTSNGNVATVNLDNSNSSTTPATGTASVIPTDASQCKFASDGVTGFESTSTHLGDYTLCQSSTDKSVVYFQLKTPPTNSNGDISICLIPTTSSGSNSIYVGNPMCGYFKDPKAVRKINFIKYAQYANATINGVIFFKDLSWYYPVYNNYMMTLDAYKTCMNMLAYGNTAYCQSFKTVGQYVFKQF
ncbi:MAG: hypothetical protein PHY93_10635 [Bacteriovorax sp.]|nr:hypothetical protein [Bacteriovorax sp.]